MKLIGGVTVLLGGPLWALSVHPDATTLLLLALVWIVVAFGVWAEVRRMLRQP